MKVVVTGKGGQLASELEFLKGGDLKEELDEVKRAYSCSDEPLGTLQDGFTLFKTPTSCITDTCVSSADNKIPKAKI